MTAIARIGEIGIIAIKITASIDPLVNAAFPSLMFPFRVKSDDDLRKLKVQAVKVVTARRSFLGFRTNFPHPSLESPVKLSLHQFAQRLPQPVSA
jgi:hypothetical protein